MTPTIKAHVCLFVCSHRNGLLLRLLLLLLELLAGSELRLARNLTLFDLLQRDGLELLQQVGQRALPVGQLFLQGGALRGLEALHGQGVLGLLHLGLGGALLLELLGVQAEVQLGAPGLLGQQLLLLLPGAVRQNGLAGASGAKGVALGGQLLAAALFFHAGGLGVAGLEVESGALGCGRGGCGLSVHS